MERRSMKFKPGMIIDAVRLAPSLKFNKGYTRLDYLHLDITSRCNLKCRMCEWRYKVEQKEMPFGIYKKAIDEGLKLGLRKIVIAATGESLVHRDFPKMIAYAHDRRLKIELVTSLSLMSDEIMNAILKINSLVVSFDGATKETYEKIRVGAGFEKTLANLKKIAENKKDMSIRINYVIQKDNFKDVDGIVELMKELVSRISYKFTHDTIGNNIPLQLDSGEMEECVERLRRAFKKMKEYGMAGDMNVDEMYLKNPENLYSGLYKPWIHDIPCYNLWLGTFVNPDGLVFPCCDFYKEKDALGDLKKQSLTDIWNSKSFNEARKRFKGRKPKVCEGCPGDNMELHRNILKVPFHKVLLDV
jgi:radical SAM protein with 4Fe4S-binding SPASM domain